MPKITRKQQKVFASSASNNGVFGSLQANDPVYSQDPDVIQSRTAYANGWNDATYSAEKLPPLEEFQSLQYLFSRQIAYIMQEGIPEWNTNDTYYKGALVKAIQSDGSFILYASLVDNNQGNLVTDTTKWVITNTSTNFHQGIPNWRNDVVYSEGDWVKTKVGSSWSIYESLQNNNLNNAVSNNSYWTIKPFETSILFAPCWFDYTVQDQSWLRADDFTWHDGTVYTNGYQHLVADVSGITAQTETIGSYTITYYQATDGHKIVMDDQMTTVADIYNESGVSWYYVLDTTNQRFKLPRTKYGFVGLRDASGKYVPESLPNITGSVDNVYVGAVSQDWNGALSSEYKSGGDRSTGSEPSSKIKFDASESSSTYQDSAPVQQRATQMYLYFYVGQFNSTATEQSAGITTSQLNQKVDVSDLIECKVVVETYSNGTSWYRIWSDGWIEQGGYTQQSSASVSVNLLKQFSDTNYNITLGVSFESGTTVTPSVDTSNKTISGFKIVHSQADSRIYEYWCACGY